MEHGKGNTSHDATEIKYSEAIELAKEWLERWQHSGAVWELCKEDSSAKALKFAPELILDWASGEPEGFDVLKEGVCGLLDSGEKLHPDVMDWLLQYLRGEVSRPKASAGKKKSTWKHLQIGIAVGRLVQKKMKATRNDASEPTSACDAVAEALAELGLEPATFHGVKRVWLDRKERYPDQV